MRARHRTEAAAARRAGRSALAMVLLLAAGACATAGSTVGSGVGERLTQRPPYYAGRWQAAAGRVAHLPVAYQQGGAQGAMFDPDGGPGTPVAALLEEMNAYLDSLGVSVRVEAQGAERGIAPDVQFGCEQTPAGECRSDSRETPVQGKPWMRLAVARPSKSWVAPVRGALERAGADHALVLSLEVGQYWTHQRGLRGDKEVRLGTGHWQDLPWLTSLDQPVQVLQLTGALVDRDGRAVRIGAEGLLARQTHLLASALGAQALIRPDDVQRLRTLRRDDLPGRPLVWQAALRELVAELASRPEVALR